MGNQCQPCQNITQGCKRQQFRQQLKNRQKLDISKSRYNNDKKNKNNESSILSGSKNNNQNNLNSILQKVNQHNKNHINQNQNQEQQSEQTYRKGNKLLQKQTNSVVNQNNNNKQNLMILKNSFINQNGKRQVIQTQKSSIKNNKNNYNYNKPPQKVNSIEEIYEDFKNIKLPIESSFKKIEEGSLEIINVNNNQIKYNNNSIINNNQDKSKNTSKSKINLQQNQALEEQFTETHIIKSAYYGANMKKDKINNQGKVVQSNINNLQENNRKGIKNVFNSNQQLDHSNIYIKDTDSIKQSKYQFVQDQPGIHNLTINHNKQKKPTHKTSQQLMKSQMLLPSTNNNRQNNKQNLQTKLKQPQSYSVYNINTKQLNNKQNKKQSGTIIQDYFNPSKVLKDFNRALKSDQDDINDNQFDQFQGQNGKVKNKQTMNNLKAKQVHFQVKRGIYFQGYTIDSKLTQKGIVKFENGTQINANFQNGQLNPNKTVKVTFNNKSVYEGQILNYKANGYGKLTYKNGSYYIGQWKNDKPFGKGKQQYIDGSFYQGDFQNGIKQGEGRFVNQNQGIIYEGQFKKNHFFGQGTLTYSDGRIYKGIFKNGELQGPGQAYYQNQSLNQNAKYIGQFRQSKKHGHGKYYYGDGRTWEGQWSQNRQNGVGKYKDQKGNIIEGIWIDGIKNQPNVLANRGSYKGQQ